MQSTGDTDDSIPIHLPDPRRDVESQTTPGSLREMLSRYCSLIFDDGDVIEVRAIDPTNWTPARSLWTPASKLMSHAELLYELNGDGSNIYAGVLPRTAEGFGDRKHVAPGHVIWMDIDHTPPDTVRQAFDRTDGSLSLPAPTFLVDSGNGTHAYWRLMATMAPDDIVRINRAVAAYARQNMGLPGADIAATDAARILRLPGTVNHKGGRVCRIVTVEYGNIYLPERWLAWADAITPPRPSSPKSSVIRSASPRGGTSGGVRGLLRAQRYLRAVPGGGEGSRNSTAYRLAAICLHEFCVSVEDTLRLLAMWDRRNTPPLADTGGPEKLREIIENARRYGRAAMV